MQSSPSSIPPTGHPRPAAAGRSESVGPLKRVKVGDRTIEYRIRRSRQRKKTYQVSIVSGEVALAVPFSTTNGQAEEMVRQKARWILSKLDVAPAKPAAPTFLSGEKLPFKGGDLTLWVQGVVSTPTGLPEVSRDRRRLKVTVPLGLDDAARGQQIEAALMTWYAHRRRRGGGRTPGPLAADPGQRDCTHGANREPEAALGQLFPHRKPAVQLAAGHAGTGLDRVRRRPRTVPSDPHEPFRRVLGAGGPTPARREGAAPAVEGTGGCPAALVMSIARHRYSPPPARFP